MSHVKVKMLTTCKGSPDGMVTNVYEEGEVYDMPDSLAEVFLDEMEVAEVFVEEEPEGESDEEPKGESDEHNERF